MIRKTFLTIIITGILGLVGCGGKTGNTTTNAGSTTKTEEPAKNLLKPGDVSSDKPVALKDLVESVKADKNGWEGKEVSVNGYVMGSSGSGGKFGYALTLKNDQKASSGEDLMSCIVPQGDLPKEILSKTVEVKGTIKEITGTGIIVRLNPCELKKQ